MAQVTSKDGTIIDLDKKGSGPLLVLVAGALQHRAVDQTTPAMADDLAEHFTVINYDRRGRGPSTDMAPYATQREIEDIEALIDANGGKGGLFGMSSGAVLALEATAALAGKVTSAFLYEPPINPASTSADAQKLHADMAALGDKGDREAMLTSFVFYTGMPEEALQGFKQSPDWAPFVAVAPTLEHDYRILADARETDAPPARWGNITVPVMVANGDASFPFMDAGAAWVAGGVPGAQRLILPGQSHEFDPKVLGPELIRFFSQH
jgi:pimeloyl-ACP methyl ester carboxylesterase